MKKEKGITLIALIITVIILLILAGVAIASLGNSGLFSKSKDAVNKYSEAEKNEQKELENYLEVIDEERGKEVILESGIIPIYTKEQFKKIATGKIVKIAEEGNKNYKFDKSRSYKIMNDIDLENDNWVSISEFNGNIDGNNKSITNLMLSTGALIESNKGDINNLSIKNITISDKENVAVFQVNEGYLDNISIDGQRLYIIGDNKGKLYAEETIFILNNYMGSLIIDGTINIKGALNSPGAVAAGAPTIDKDWIGVITTQNLNSGGFGI